MARTYKNRKNGHNFPSLNPQISRGLLAIFLFILSGIAILSFFSMAGVVGQFVDSLLAITFGQVRYVFPIILIVLAILIVKDFEYDYRSTHLFGAILFFLSFNGLVHLQKPFEQLYDLAIQGNGGGLFGLALSWPLLKYVGYWGGLLILAGILLISLIFLFNTSLAAMVGMNKKIFLAFGWVGRQIIGFFSLFKKKPSSLRMEIKGEYTSPDDDEKEDIKKDDEEQEERRIFHKKNLNKNDTEEKIEDKDAISFKQPNKIDYRLPPLDLLGVSKTKPSAGDIEQNAAIIKDTLHNFGIEVEMGEIRVGPTVSQYSLAPAKGIKLTRITSLSNDFALALAAHPIRIEAPIPGKSLVGIEVPNQKIATVMLRELLESPEFKHREHNLMMALGKDVAGKVWCADLPKMPHLLIAGSTGSGKTVCINTIILSLIYQNTPETLRFIMVDPKRVELTLYNGIPHLLTPVITDPAKTVSALRWTMAEMDRRFDVLAGSATRDIHSYNKTAKQPMPHIVFIIDELADLMSTAASEVEGGIIRIAQMARAVGIHLIVATQRPSVEVITGLMKANIPARIAFSVASIIDSRTILDCPGAEKLLGRGDMLYLTAELSKPKRLQGAYVSEDEMKKIVDYVKGDEPPQYDDSIVNKNSSPSGTLNLFGGYNDDHDPFFEEAKKIILESGKASATLLQRRMKVGYARAARLLDELEEAGIVGPADGAKPREVFTEHLRPEIDQELPLEEQTMDAGGTVFDENQKEEENINNENLNSEETDKSEVDENETDDELTESTEKSE